MIVDEDPDILAVIVEVLRGGGPCEVTQLAADSATVDDIARAKPDLVVLDLRLGAEDQGWRLLHEVRADAGLEATPVILCSSEVLHLRERAAEIELHEGHLSARKTVQPC
ncbi:MAG: response regulator [Candidatus Limnocylindria bacterium]